MHVSGQLTASRVRSLTLDGSELESRRRDSDKVWERDSFPAHPDMDIPSTNIPAATSHSYCIAIERA